MKKSFLAITVLLVTALTMTSCDFLRKLAGRPTSADIAAIREAIKAKEDALQATPEAEKQDSLVRTDSLGDRPAIPAVSQDPAPQQTAGRKRFYVIIASFSKEENAAKCARRMEERGYSPELLSFKGGYTAVGICGTDDEQQAKDYLQEVKRQDFCPEGVWIIDRNKR